MTTPNLKDLSKKELRKLAKKYGIEVPDDAGKKDMRKLIKNAEKNGKALNKSKEDLIVDFIKSMVAIEEAIEPYKEQRKELRKQYKDNHWLDAKEQKRALQAMRLLKSGENMDALLKCYKDIQKNKVVKEID